MSRALQEGQEVQHVDAQRYVKTPDGRWVKPAPGEKYPKALVRWRAQGSVKLPGGEVIKGDRTGPTKDAAKTNLRDHLNAALAAAKARPSTLTTLTLAELIEQKWLPADRSENTASTRYAYERCAQRHLLGPVPRPELASVRATDVTPDDVSHWLLGIAQSSGESSAVLARGMLGNVYAWARARRLVLASPTTDAKVPKGVKARRVSGKSRPGPSDDLDPLASFSPGERGRILDHAEASDARDNQDLADLCLFLDALGPRLGEALSLRWSDIDLTGKGWARRAKKPRVKIGRYTVRWLPGGEGPQRVEHGLTKRRDDASKGEREVDLPPHVLAMLVRRECVRRSDWVFPNPLDATKPRDPSRVTKLLRALLDSVPSDEGGKDKTLTWASSHTFRTTVITDLLEAGRSPRQVIAFTGHGSVQVVYDHYLARANVNDVAEALATRAPIR